MNPENVESNEDMVEKARQLLTLTDLVDKYPAVMARRVAGLVYLIIAGGMSFTTLIFMSLQDILGPGNPFLINLGFVILSLVFSWIVAFRLVVPLTRSYPQEPKMTEGSRATLVIWGILAVTMVVVSLFTFLQGADYLFPPILQFIMGTGFLSNYILGRRETSVEFYTREHLFFSLAVFLGIIPMLMLPTIAYVFLIVIDMGGIYVIGIYMLITSERLLLASKGQG
ncbi:MAG: hypothetical protein ACXAAO_04770 [Candidatus Thorarchaeota archaeon]|jgi:hypothetical protein